MNNSFINYLFFKKRVQGHHVFDPSYNKPIKRLYRTNPSIPRPESRYGTRSGVYEQILNYKKQNLDSNGKYVLKLCCTLLNNQ